ncbi:phage holin family protein [Schaalia sp. Marseille-Q2122]|uniref:phage holin family protein n=1 Tax=Schaalia sp. Marseille-Q2122 TaxID=2736604 RepID=UPI00158DB27E|nr:phage holin family protein [Schaalia sp. Marseille-Q2122]
MKRFLLQLAATIIGIWVATLLVPGVSFGSGSGFFSALLTLAAIALVFTAVNSIVHPLVKTLAAPLYVLTFGLFALVTNALMFMLTGWLSGKLGIPFEVSGFWAALFGALVTAIVSSLAAGVLGVADDKK